MILKPSIYDKGNIESSLFSDKIRIQRILADLFNNDDINTVYLLIFYPTIMSKDLNLLVYTKFINLLKCILYTISQQI